MAKVKSMDSMETSSRMNTAGLFDSVPTFGDNNTVTPNSEKVQMIPVDALVEDEHNEQIYNMYGIEALAISIKKYGLQEPLRVYQMPEKGKYLIQSGHRRRRAALIGNLKEVPAIVIPWEPDEKVRMRNLIICNLNNRVKSPMTIAREYKEFGDTLDDQAHLIENIANAMGKSTAQIRRYLVLLDLIPALQEKVEKEDVYAMSAITEARNMTVEQQEEFNAQLDDFVEEKGEDKVTRDVIVSIAKSIKNEKEIAGSNNAPKIFNISSLISGTKKYASIIDDTNNLSDEDRKQAKDILNELKEKIEECISNL